MTSKNSQISPRKIVVPAAGSSLPKSAESTPTCAASTDFLGAAAQFFAQFSDAHCHLPAVPAHGSADGEICIPDDKICVPDAACVLLNCSRAADFDRVAALAARFPGRIVPAFGIHPWFADEWTLPVAAKLRRLLAGTPRACVGEIGLDRARVAPAVAVQEIAFREQLALAAEFGVPVTIHCVRAFGKTEAILREFFLKNALPPFLLHAYAGSAEQAKNFARLGGVFSAPRRALPPECIVVPETDAPLGENFFPAGTRAPR